MSAYLSFWDLHSLIQTLTTLNFDWNTITAEEAEEPLEIEETKESEDPEEPPELSDAIENNAVNIFSFLSVFFTIAFSDTDTHHTQPREQ